MKCSLFLAGALVCILGCRSTDSKTVGATPTATGRAAEQAVNVEGAKAVKSPEHVEFRPAYVAPRVHPAMKKSTEMSKRDQTKSRGH